MESTETEWEWRSKTPGQVGEWRTKTPGMERIKTAGLERIKTAGINRSKTPVLPFLACPTPRGRCPTPSITVYRSKTPGVPSSVRCKTPGLVSVKSGNRILDDFNQTIIDDSTEVRIGPDNDWAQITIPGLSASHFTRKGALNVSEIHNLMFTGMWAIGRHSYYPGYHRLIQGETNNLFLVCSDLHISKQFHEDTRHQFLNLPMDFMEYRHRVNDASYSMERSLMDAETKGIFVAGTDTYVTGAKSYGPITLPPEFSKRFKFQVGKPPTKSAAAVKREKTAAGGKRRKNEKNDKRRRKNEAGEGYGGKYVQVPLPDKTYQYRVRVAPSDCESNDTPGSQGYSRFIMDCAVNAGKSGFYDKTFVDVARLEVSRQSLVYVGRARPGHELLVRTWEDTDRHDTLHFQIMHAAAEGCGKTVVHGFTCFHMDTKVKDPLLYEDLEKNEIPKYLD